MIRSMMMLDRRRYHWFVGRWWWWCVPMWGRWPRLMRLMSSMCVYQRHTHTHTNFVWPLASRLLVHSFVHPSNVCRLSWPSNIFNLIWWDEQISSSGSSRCNNNNNHKITEISIKEVRFKYTNTHKAMLGWWPTSIYCIYYTDANISIVSFDHCTRIWLCYW